MTATWTGRERFERQMKRMTPEARAAIRPALQASGGQLATLARRLVPVKTGKLRQSIKVSMGGDTPKGGRKSVLQGDPDLRVVISAGDKDAFYAAFVEFGTVKTDAHPYFFPAYRALKRGMKARIARAVSKATRTAVS